MAVKMIKCDACGDEIASSAKTCPKCGAKVKKPLNFKALGVVALLVVALFVGKMIIDNMNASIVTVNGVEYTAKEIQKLDNTYGILNEGCTIVMVVDKVDQEFQKIQAKDDAYISWWMREIPSDVEKIMKTLKSGDKIKATGTITFIGPWQLEIKAVQKIEVISE